MTTMTNTGREKFQAMAGGDLWKAHHALLDMPVPQSGDARLEWLLDDLKVRELMATYCFAHDSKDIGWMQSLFTEDGTLNPNGSTHAGRDEIGVQYGKWNSAQQFGFRRYTNPIIRFDAGNEQGWVGAYFQSAVLEVSGKRRSRFGRYFGRLLKQAGTWRIADWRISVDSTLEFTDEDLETLWNGRLPEQPAGTHRDVVLDGTRKQFYDIAEDSWGGARWIVNEPVRAETREEKIALLTENIKVRDHFARYVESYDSSNVARVMDVVIAEDSLHQTRRDGLAFLVGKDEIRKQYQVWNASRRISFHRVANIVARILPGGREAWACGYFNAPIIGHTNEFQSQYGGYFFRFLKENGDWRMADRRGIGPGVGMAVFPYKTPEAGAPGAWNSRLGGA